MLNRVLAAAVLGFAVTLCAAPAAPPKTVAAPAANAAVPTITVDQFKALVKAKKRHVLIDVRTPEEFKAGHINGAVLMPLDRLPQIYKQIPRGVKLVVACRTGHRSGEAVKFLLLHGYASAVSLDGGFQKWTACAGKARC